ncbi:MAG TPA: cupin domain-containing protein [Rhizomicrobium sp.]|jgi:quercetin dioxygenase-like cupin family protein
MKKLSMAVVLSAVGTLACAGTAIASDVKREPLATLDVQPRKPVDRVEVKRLTLSPGGKTGPHTHPGPTISYVVAGTLIVQVGNAEAKTFHTGEVIYEPGNTTITRFDNASEKEPAVFVTSYLLSSDDKDIIHMIAPTP